MREFLFPAARKFRGSVGTAFFNPNDPTMWYDQNLSSNDVLPYLPDSGHTLVHIRDTKELQDYPLRHINGIEDVPNDIISKFSKFEMNQENSTKDKFGFATVLYKESQECATFYPDGVNNEFLLMNLVDIKKRFKLCSFQMPIEQIVVYSSEVLTFGVRTISSSYFCILNSENDNYFVDPILISNSDPSHIEFDRFGNLWTVDCFRVFRCYSYLDKCVNEVDRFKSSFDSFYRFRFVDVNCICIADKTSLSLLQLQTIESIEEQLIFSFPHTDFEMGETIRDIQVSPLNANCLIIVTTDYVIIIDTRFPQKYCLRYEHKMKSQSLDVHLCILDSELSLVQVFLSSSSSFQTIAYHEPLHFNGFVFPYRGLANPRQIPILKHCSNLSGVGVRIKDNLVQIYHSYENGIVASWKYKRKTDKAEGFDNEIVMSEYDLCAKQVFKFFKTNRLKILDSVLNFSSPDESEISSLELSDVAQELQSLWVERPPEFSQQSQTLWDPQPEQSIPTLQSSQVQSTQLYSSQIQSSQPLASQRTRSRRRGF